MTRARPWNSDCSAFFPLWVIWTRWICCGTRAVDLPPPILPIAALPIAENMATLRFKFCILQERYIPYTGDDQVSISERTFVDVSVVPETTRRLEYCRRCTLSRELKWTLELLSLYCNGTHGDRSEPTVQFKHLPCEFKLMLRQTLLLQLGNYNPATSLIYTALARNDGRNIVENCEKLIRVLLT